MASSVHFGQAPNIARRRALSKQPILVAEGYDKAGQTQHERFLNVTGICRVGGTKHEATNQAKIDMPRDLYP